jgi:predicted dehydrogenase
MVQKKRLKVGIAGYGVVGKRRRQCIDTCKGLKAVAVCDQKFKGTSVMEDGVKCSRNYGKLLKEPLDVLFVCLPNYLAAEVTIAGLKRGMHVFCEKPPGKDVKDIQEVIEEEKKHPDLNLKYGFNHRYHESVRDAMRIIRSCELGDIINLRGVYGKSKIIPFQGGWRAERKYSGGGILLDQGIHMVDLMRLFCGEFREVKSYISNSYWHHDVEDNAYAIMRDRKGRVAMLNSSATQWQHSFELNIALTEGYIKLEGILSGSKSYGEEKLIIGRRIADSDVGTSREETITYLEDNSWQDEVNEFADVVLKGKKIKTGTSKDALQTMKVVYRIYNADPEWSKKYCISDPDKKQCYIKGGR